MSDDDEIKEEYKKDSLGDGVEYTILAIFVLVVMMSLRATWHG